jgi:cobalt/nickel transport system permease protein
MTMTSGFDGAANGSGLLARLDPRTRLLAALALAATTASLPSVGPAVLALALAVGFAIVAGIDRRETLHRLAHVEGFMLVLLVVLPFVVPGRPLLSVGTLVASVEGATRALVIALKVNAAVLFVLALVAPLGTAAVGRALHRLGVPDKLVQLFLFTVRYIDVFAAERTRLTTAMKVRGFVPRFDRHSLTTWGRLIGTLVLRSVERAERVARAMRLRGFDGRIHRVDSLAFGRADVMAGAGVAVACALLLIAGRLT